MQQLQMTLVLMRDVRFVGLLYLVIIVAGLSAELFRRGPLINLGDENVTATAILLAPELALAFGPAYALTILAETAFCLRLLLRSRAGHKFPGGAKSPYDGQTGEVPCPKEDLPSAPLARSPSAVSISTRWSPSIAT